MMQKIANSLSEAFDLDPSQVLEFGVKMDAGKVIEIRAFFVSSVDSTVEKKTIRWEDVPKVVKA